MGRLFWKIFIIILLGHATAVGTISLITQLATPLLPPLDTQESSGERRPSAPDITSVNETATLLQSQGVEGARKKYGKHAPVFIVDEQGKDILGQSIPMGLLDAAKFAHENTPDAPHVKQVTLSGLHYLIFPPMPEGSPESRPPHTEPPPAAVLWFMSKLPIIVATTVSLLYAIFLAWYLAKPIRTLRTAFAEVAAGNLQVTPHVDMGKRRDELADLGNDFSSMAEQLRTLLEEKRRLLHDISHELRSPLARLQVAIDLARQQPEKLNSTLERVELESRRMDTLIGELLTLSKLEANHREFTREEIHLDELVNDIVNDAHFEAQGQNKQVLLSGQLDASIQGNPDLLRRAFENVIRNAIKHTPEHTIVSVALHHSAQQVHIAVSDQGTGVPESELDKIFEPFFRSNSQSKKRTGFGLGLAITQRVMEAHGGTIKARNNSGGGLRVDMALPVVAT